MKFFIFYIIFLLVIFVFIPSQVMAGSELQRDYTDSLAADATLM